MKSLTQIFDENPYTKEINLSNHLIRDADDIFSALSRFPQLEIVSKIHIILNNNNLIVIILNNSYSLICLIIL